MKILHLIQKPQNRGAETFACQLASHQVVLGHKVMVVAIFTGEAELPWEGEIVSLNGNSSNRFFDYAAWKKLTFYIKEFQPDILQANSGDTLKYAVLSKLLFGWKVPIVFRNASEVGRYLNSYFQKQFNQLLYKNVDGIISVSHASKKDFLKHFKSLTDRTQVISIGLEDDLNIDEVSYKPEGKQNIVHVGGFSFEKNHRGLINIFQKVLFVNERVHLHLIGDGPLRSEVEDLVNDRNLGDHVSFYGFVKNPLSFIKSADILVLPSIIEGLPGVLLEAMFCKTPVVAYDVGGISEIVSECSGSLIRKDDEQKFAEAILNDLENPDPEKIDYAFQQVRNHYMNKEITNKFMVAYTGILEK